MKMSLSSGCLKKYSSLRARGEPPGTWAPRYQLRKFQRMICRIEAGECSYWTERTKVGQ
jgi:hypothetical protein